MARISQGGSQKIIIGNTCDLYLQYIYMYDIVVSIRGDICNFYFGKRRDLSSFRGVRYFHTYRVCCRAYSDNRICLSQNSCVYCRAYGGALQIFFRDFGRGGLSALPVCGRDNNSYECGYYRNAADKSQTKMDCNTSARGGERAILRMSFDI